MSSTAARAPRTSSGIQPRAQTPSGVVSTFVCFAVAVLLAAALEPFRHWFVIPVSICGSLIGRDAVNWLRGSFDLFDPRGVLGAIGLYFFFLAPLLHVATNYWVEFVRSPGDWRPWVGGMAMLNAIGIALYQVAASRSSRRSVSIKPRPRRVVGSRFAVLVVGALLLSAILQLFVYVQAGGVSGYIQTFEAEGRNAFEGQGLLFMFSESFPIVCILAFGVQRLRHDEVPPWIFVVLVLLAFMAGQVLFGGFRGNRSNIVWSIFWATGIIHLGVRRIGRATVIAGLCVLLPFLYFYGFYKNVGLEAIQRVGTESGRLALEAETGRSAESFFLGDLDRADIQAFILYQLERGNPDYSLALGRTYVGAMSILVPERLWESRPPTKIKEGTEVQFGEGSYKRGGFASLRVYGIAGEAMLNFGPLAVPAAYALLGVFVGRLQAFRKRLGNRDPRLLMIPFLTNLALVLLINDSDNAVFFAVKYGLVPAALLWFGSARVTVKGSG